VRSDEPRPLDCATVRKETSLARGRPLAFPASANDRAFAEVIQARETRRSIRAPYELSIAALLWHACRIRRTATDGHGRSWRSTPAPNSGGVAAVRIIVDEGRAEPWLYDSLTHSARVVAVVDPQALREAREERLNMLPDSSGWGLYLFVDTEALRERYDHSISLAWRDAGALITICSLVSEWLDLAFCPIGILGHAMALATGYSDLGWIPVGAASVGLRLEACAHA
jgi:hypothetical protein